MHNEFRPNVQSDVSGQVTSRENLEKLKNLYKTPDDLLKDTKKKLLAINEAGNKEIALSQDKETKEKAHAKKISQQKKTITQMLLISHLLFIKTPYLRALRMKILFTAQMAAFARRQKLRKIARRNAEIFEENIKEEEEKEEEENMERLKAQREADLKEESQLLTPTLDQQQAAETLEPSQELENTANAMNEMFRDVFDLGEDFKLLLEPEMKEISALMQEVDNNLDLLPDEIEQKLFKIADIINDAFNRTEKEQSPDNPQIGRSLDMCFNRFAQDLRQWATGRNYPKLGDTEEDKLKSDMENSITSTTLRDRMEREAAVAKERTKAPAPRPTPKARGEGLEDEQIKPTTQKPNIPPEETPKRSPWDLTNPTAIPKPTDPPKR